MPAVVADDSLRPPGRARRVQHVERVGGRDRHRIDRLSTGHQLVPVQVAARQRLAGSLVALHDDAGRRGVLGDLEGGVDHRLVVDGAGRLDATRRGDDGGGAGVVDARGEFVRREAAEHHRVHGAQPRTRQHRDDGLGNHRHVDHDAVALADAEPAQRAGEPRCLVEEFAVGVGALRAGHRRVVDQRKLVAAPALDMAVQRVGAGVQLGVGEPAVERRVRVVEDPARLPGPGHGLRGVGPEGRGV